MADSGDAAKFPHFSSLSPSPSSSLPSSSWSALESASDSSVLSSPAKVQAPAITASLSGGSGIAASHLPPPPLSSPPTPSTMAGWLAWLFCFFFQVVPSVLYWVITFGTITLPSWLFTLFSMSLTFTMNFTTLYVFFGASVLSFKKW